jgi:GT2 family glycosyltransferase
MHKTNKQFGIVIITYNRPTDMLALLKNIVNLEQKETYLQEIIVVNNCSTENYSEVEQFCLTYPELIFFFNATENLGVSRGRNFAIEKSTAPYLIMLDDDAELENMDALIELHQEFTTENTSKEKAIVSFKVLFYETNTLQENALPHKKIEKYKNKSWFETYYFAGGAHCIKREALDKIGHYSVDFFYGMEEYDLSYRLLNQGYAIVYTNKVVMLHKESPYGRTTRLEKLVMLWVNKTIVAQRYLPTRYVISTAIIWSGFMLIKSKFNVVAYIKGWKKMYKAITRQKVTKISKETLQHLKKLEARLWY